MNGIRMGELARLARIGGDDIALAMKIFQFGSLVEKEAAQEEREACAKLCEDHEGIELPSGQRLPPDGGTLARAIRMRSNEQN